MSLSVDRVLLKAKRHAKKGEIDDAEALYGTILDKYPANKRAQQGLAALKPAFVAKNSSIPTRAQIKALVALYNQGRFEDVITQASALTRRFPGAVILFNLLGQANTGLRRFDEAIENYTRALKIQPTYAEAHNNLGNTLREKGDLPGAIESYRHALQIQPDVAEIHYNLGGALKAIRDLPAAIESYSQALGIRPDHPTALAQKLYLQAQICDWDDIDQNLDQLYKINVTTEIVSPFSLLSLEDHPAHHRQWSECYARNKNKQLPLPVISRPSRKPERLRIGYFSADFHQHAMMCLTARLFELHDRDRFEIHAYYFGRIADSMTNRARDAFDRFHDVRRLSDQAVAEMARRDQIDIAIDLGGYTTDSRSGIFAYRAAPLQVNYLGYPGTTGASYMDYLIADPVLIPEESQKFYTEKLIYLPDSYMPNDNTRLISESCPSRAECGLPDSGIVFCCFNNNYKIQPDVFGIWMRLLKKVDGSVLWLFRANKWSDKNLRKEAQARGIDPDRLVFADWVPLEDHLARHRHADIFLDTFSCNAHTTASDALWAGLPVVTKIGEGFAARVAGSLLTAIGLQELITTTDQDYEQLALTLARNPAKRESIKTRLAENRDKTPLFDTERLTKNIEQAFTKIYDRYFSGKGPEHHFVRGGEAEG